MALSESTLLTLADWHRVVLDGQPLAPLLQARLARLQRSATPHAWIQLVSESALAGRCAQLQALVQASGTQGADLLRAFPLFGVPFAAKDNIDALGFDTTAACPAWAHAASANATVVQKLLDAGAVLLGKTNLDQFATGLVGTRSPYGAPASRFAVDRVSGGSSSGSAVAVAAGEVVFALGTDTAGSGRVPAGFNQLVGLKPTPGRVSTAGVLPACRSIDCVSVFALTVDDAAAVLAVLEGPDEADPYCQFSRGPARLPARPRVGVPAQPLLDATQAYDSAWQLALARLGTLQADTVALDFEPLHAVARLLYEGPWVAERYATVQTLLDSKPEALDRTVASVIAKARQFSAVDSFRAQYELQAARQKLAALWDTVDLLMAPTTPRHPSFAELAADPVGANAVLGTYTNFVNLLGWCALALPSGTAAEGLPFGVTFIGPAQADAALARWGQAWQACTGLPLGATGRAAEPSAHPAASVRWPATQATLPLAVVGAHLSGLPLNGQLLERGAVLRQAATTAPKYRLYALPGTTPPKPGLVRVPDGGASLAVEVWDMPMDQLGSFLALIPQPLGLGTLELADGSTEHGFLCESVAIQGARDISNFGGWRSFMAATAGGAA
jgi:allophanate hydrolase